MAGALRSTPDEFDLDDEAVELDLDNPGDARAFFRCLRKPDGSHVDVVHFAGQGPVNVHLLDDFVVCHYARVVFQSYVLNGSFELAETTIH